MVNLKTDHVLVLVNDESQVIIHEPIHLQTYLNINNNTTYTLKQLKIFRVSSLVI